MGGENRRILSLVLLASLMAFAFVAWMSWIASVSTEKHKVATAQLPLSFEVNRGQAAADAKFVARGGGYALALTDRGEPVLALQGRFRQAAQQRAERQRQTS